MHQSILDYLMFSKERNRREATSEIILQSQLHQRSLAKWGLTSGDGARWDVRVPDGEEHTRAALISIKAHESAPPTVPAPATAGPD